MISRAAYDRAGAFARRYLGAKVLKLLDVKAGSSGSKAS